jgi:hypothetical protein
MEYELVQEERLVSNRTIFDFFVVASGACTAYVVWSEYNADADQEITIYSIIFDGASWKESELVCTSKFAYPNIRITTGYGGTIHLLLARARGSIDELILVTHDGTTWRQTKIRDVKTRTFGHSIAASKERERIYIVFGDYQERYFFPYVLAAPLSGHICKDFGKLSVITGDGVRWREPMRITDRGRFSCGQPSICLNDRTDTLHCVWMDERHGFRERAIYYGYSAGKRFSSNTRVSKHNQMVFSPFISCDQQDNVHMAWSTMGRDKLGSLYYREQRGGTWQNIVELSEKGLMNDMAVDLLGNVHCAWSNGNNAYYQVKANDGWSKAHTLGSRRAKLCVDESNDIHLVFLQMQKDGRDSLVYKGLRWLQDVTTLGVSEPGHS